MFFGSTGQLQLDTDLHSHLIPGVDDGVKTIEQSIEIIKKFQALGYSKLITTPHISELYYPNSPDILRPKFQFLKNELDDLEIEIELELGAEYLVDAAFLNELKVGGDLLSWNGFVLIETPFTNFPLIFDQVIFEIETRGLTAVLAHPERYEYSFGNTNRIKELRERGVKMQVTAGSLAGYYGSAQKKMAKSLIRESLVDFIGSDLHRMDQIGYFEKGLRSKCLRNLDSQRLLNRKLQD